MLEGKILDNMDGRRYVGGWWNNKQSHQREANVDATVTSKPDLFKFQIPNCRTIVTIQQSSALKALFFFFINNNDDDHQTARRPGAEQGQQQQQVVVSDEIG